MTKRNKALMFAVIAAGTLLLAAGFGVLADRMTADRNAFVRADGTYALGQLPANRWAMVSGMLTKPADDLLSLKDDRAYRRALALFWESQPIGSPQWIKKYRPATRALLAIAEDQTASPDRRASAWNAMGILEFQAAILSASAGQPEAAQQFLAMCVEAFGRAVAINDTDMAARHNLELIQTFSKSKKKNGDGPVRQPGRKPPGSGY